MRQTSPLHERCVNNHFTKHLPLPQCRERVRSLTQRIHPPNSRFELALRGPIQRSHEVLLIPAIAANQLLLFDKYRPQFQRHFAPRCRPARHNRPAARQTGEALLQNLPAHVLDHQIDAPLAGQFSDSRRPIGPAAIDGVFGAKAQGELSPGITRTGGDDSRAEAAGDLDGRRSNPAGAADGQDPIAGTGGRAHGQHVHGSAPRKGQRRGRQKINIFGKTNQRSRGDSDHFRESAIAFHSQKLAFETERLSSARAKFALTAENIGLHGHTLALAPPRDVTAHARNFPGDFASWNTR